MFTMIAMIAAFLLAVLLIFVVTRPDTFRIERRTTINAPPEKIFHLIANFRQWEAWSPWEKVDPTALRSYTGSGSGKGAVYVWQGNRKLGVGRMEIVEATSPSLALIKIDFEAPMTAHNTIKFELERQGATTRVTQAMYGPSPFLSKLVGVIFNMEKMVGCKFEEGLSNLKMLAEKSV